MPYTYRKRSPTCILGCVLAVACAVVILGMAIDGVIMIARW